MQSIKFKLGNKDYINFTSIVMRRNSMSIIFWSGWVILVVVFAFLMSAFDSYYPLIALVVSIFFWYYIWSKNVKYTDPNGAFSREQTFKISKEGIETKSTLSSSVCKWKGILQIENNKDYLFYYVDKVQAYIIPKSSFSNAAKAEEFYDKSLKLWKKSK